MINDRYRCIFVHIPRVGGTSIELALTGLDWWNAFHIPGVLIAKVLNEGETNIVLNEHNEALKKLMDFQPKHMSVEETCLIHSEFWRGYYKFAFVRNPWDRLVSIYKNLEGILEGCKLQDTSWQKLVITCYKERGYINDYYEMVRFSRFVHRFRPMPWETKHKLQVGFLQECEGYEKLDFIGRFESLEKDFDLVCNKIDFPSVKLQKENPSNHGPYKDYYDAETCDFVAQEYAEDIKAFNYEF